MKTKLTLLGAVAMLTAITVASAEEEDAKVELAPALTCGVSWNGSACGSSTTAQNVFCARSVTIDNVDYDVQQDQYVYMLGRIFRASRVLDCQTACTEDEVPSKKFDQLC